MDSETYKTYLYYRQQLNTAKNTREARAYFCKAEKLLLQELSSLKKEEPLSAIGVPAEICKGFTEVDLSVKTRKKKTAELDADGK
ncbi:hypothetical protein AWH56_018635 [Anaerobacillus isosaccharinicus]|uniref:Uncharacterized protein n=1 Tax=Anaerobacillus isosaccharinicus TaxID=1532552 RepID=A0A1S2M7I7_9BACI|nr:hypothetical protein [Anaerobacillus isosaccharinicus]MBA5587078.1 hypothetical protein [Anaerobacillus isosaccharinicus]QOY34726.1 hypothetical protein AWH56_018635 [Anaerobacillus isosaccharinicus]